MGLFGRNKVNESDYDMRRKGNYRAEGKDYLPQNNGWYECVRCGKKIRWKDAEVDHIVPQSKGGRDNAYNLQVMCKRCNTSKGNRTTDTAKDLQRRKKEMNSATKDLEKVKREMLRDAKKDAKKSMSKSDYNKFYGKNRGKGNDEVERAIRGSDKEFNDFMNSI